MSISLLLLYNFGVSLLWKGCGFLVMYEVDLSLFLCDEGFLKFETDDAKISLIFLRLIIKR